MPSPGAPVAEERPESGHLSRDAFFHGRVVISQPKRGYRFSVDAPLLADFLPAGLEPALEVGCGSGVVSLLALHREKFAAVTALEIQPGLAELAERNAVDNRRQDRLRVVRGDFRERFPEFAGCRLVFSNPPFLPVGRGRLSADPQVRQAKFELTLGPIELAQLAARILAPDGSLCLIVPFDRGASLLTAAETAGLTLFRRRAVQPAPGRPPNRVLLDLRRAGTPAPDLAPLVVFREPGRYSLEMERIFAGEG
jgi:tRNA1(Val) A37 N6-methylase TrmN6